MEYARIKGIDKKVSRLVQGTIMLTEKETEKGFELLDTAWEAGYNAFDTAALYGGGTCERVFGAWMEARGVREQTFVIGKSCHHNGDRRRVTSFDIAADLHDSLARQRTDYVDLHLLHRDDAAVEVGPIVDALNEHVDAGRMRAFGGSNWSPERIEEANEYADKNGLVPFTASSPNFSLAAQAQVPWEGCLSISGPSHEQDRAWYRQQDMPLFTWSSLANGFMAGRVSREIFASKPKSLGQMMLDTYCHEDNFNRLDRVQGLAAEKEVSIAQLALSWVLHQDLNVFALVGPLTPAECRANAEVFEVALSAPELEWLDLGRDSR
jgi:aryl-alcohol dehydrogenase-like predicted oxidoreductase